VSRSTPRAAAVSRPTIPGAGVRCPRVSYVLHAVIGPANVLDTLRHPTIHAMQPLRFGLGLCPVRTEVAKDEPVAPVPGELPHLTESVFGYAAALSERTPVIYVAADFAGGGGDQAACGWAAGRLELGPLRSHHDRRPRPARGLSRRPRAPTGAIDEALAWLGVTRPRRTDRFAAVGLGERHDWEP
jgi:hypothetical protein